MRYAIIYDDEKGRYVVERDQPGKAWKRPPVTTLGNFGQALGLAQGLNDDMEADIEHGEIL